MHVVVLGAGYAGLTLTRLLERDLPTEVDLTIVNDSPDHLVQHELHHVIRRPEVAADVTIPLTRVLDRASVRVATVEEIDRDERLVKCSNGSLSYDVCAICLGAQTAFYGLEGVREHATPVKRLHHADRIREKFLDVVDEKSGATGDESTTETGESRLVVGGAGLSGIQVAGELAALARDEGAMVTITLLEQDEDVAPDFPENFRRAVRSELVNQGVDVRTDETVVRADESFVHLDGSDRLRYDQLIWTGGIRGPNALENERPTVRSDLRLDDRTFVLGDAARVVDANGQTVPASAQSAVREARTVAENVSRLIEADLDGAVFEPRMERFAFDSPGWLVSVGDSAVAQVGPSVVTGRSATALKTTVGIGYLSSVGAADSAFVRVLSEKRRLTND